MFKIVHQSIPFVYMLIGAKLFQQLVRRIHFRWPIKYDNVARWMYRVVRLNGYLEYLFQLKRMEEWEVEGRIERDVFIAF